MVFTGTMDWMPNEDGVAYFVDKIFPLVRRDVPAAAFWVVGRRPPRRIQALASPAITVTGAVDDIRPYLGKPPSASYLFAAAAEPASKSSKLWRWARPSSRPPWALKDCP